MSDELEEYARRRVGSTLGKYRLERLLGCGGMAAVYEGQHRNGNRVAIKVLHAHIGGLADAKARFLREGYVANKVGHSGAVRVLDDEVAADGSVFLVMELLEGQTLESRAAAYGHRLPAPEVCEIAVQLLEILAAAHAKGIIHRDIKPENVFRTVEGQLKVLDFGIARLHDAAGGASATRTGSMMGTPNFLPPEQALGKLNLVDGQTDLFAVAATMFTLVSGRFVHEGETAQEVLVKAASQPVAPVRMVAPDLHPAVAEVIDRGLRAVKAERWADAPTMARALGDAYAAAYGRPLAGGRASAVPVAPTVRGTEFSMPLVTPSAAPFAGPSMAQGRPPSVPAFGTAGSGTEMPGSGLAPVRGPSTTAGVVHTAPPAAPPGPTAAAAASGRRSTLTTIALLAAVGLGAAGIVVFASSSSSFVAHSAEAPSASGASPQPAAESSAPAAPAPSGATALTPLTADPAPSPAPAPAPAHVPPLAPVTMTAAQRAVAAIRPPPAAPAAAPSPEEACSRAYQEAQAHLGNADARDGLQSCIDACAASHQWSMRRDCATWLRTLEMPVRAPAAQTLPAEGAEPAAPAAGAAPDCTVNYYVDSRGIRHIRPECK